MGRKRKQRKPAIEGDTSSLPCEVIYNILSKLPVKSLLRFRCVCKSWRAVISEPKFAKSHLNESIKLDRQRLLNYDICTGYFYSMGYESCEDSEEKLSFPGKKYWNAEVLCCCNGLVLFRAPNDKMCVLWNPSIRECKKFSCPSHIYRNYIPRGLCYDSSMDDYKVIFISKAYEKYSFVIFSFRDQCWTEPRIFPYVGFRGDMVIANGVLHWVAKTPRVHNSNTHIFVYAYDLMKTYVIVYFDMVDGKFKEIPTPNCIKEGEIFSLTVMRGCLSLYCNTIDKKHVVVWTMKQYGENNSWSKFIVIPSWLGKTHPLCATKKGEVVMIIDGRRTIIYDPKENKWRSLDQTKIWKPILHVDSLVLPIRTPRVKGRRKKEL